MGSVIFSALLSVIQKNPQLLEDVLTQAFTWLLNELKKQNAPKA